MSTVATVVVSIITIVVLAIVFDPTKPKRYSAEGHRLQLPPTVPWTFILLRIGKISSLLREMHEHYGDLVSIHFPLKGTIVVALSNKASQWFHTSSTKELHDMMILFEEWLPKFPESLNNADSNKLILRSFSTQFYEHIVANLQDTLRVRLAAWSGESKSGASLDVLDEGVRMVLDVNTEVMLGDDWDPKDLTRFKEAFLICEPNAWITNVMYLAFPFLGREKRQESNKVLIETLLRQCQKHLDQGLQPDKFNLDYFLSEKNLMQSVWQGWSLLMGSFVTTAYTFAWLIHHMASDPELQQRVRAEIESVVPKDTHLTLEHISKMHLMDSLVREVIRMHQHGPMGRAAQADIKFGEFDIPKGTAIAMALPAIHFNDENFVEAAKFKPDRFLNEEGQFDAADKVRSCTLTVFGAGRHPCLGMRLATTELKVFTYELLSKYDLVMANNPPTPVTLGMGFDEPKTRFQIVPRGGRD